MKKMLHISVFLIVLPIVYVSLFGWVLPACCRLVLPIDSYCVYQPVWFGSTCMLQVSAFYCVYQPVWLSSTSMLQVRLIHGYFCKHMLLFFYLFTLSFGKRKLEKTIILAYESINFSVYIYRMANWLNYRLNCPSHYKTF